MNEVLRLDDVTLRRGENQVLDGITWGVEPTDRWVILGPNGAGKTSLITLCSARAHPTTGTCRRFWASTLGDTDTHELRIRVGLARPRSLTASRPTRPCTTSS